MGVVLACKDLCFKEKLSNSKIMTSIYSSGICNKYNLSPSTMVVLFSLSYHFNTIRFDMFPKQNYIVQKTGLSASSIKRAIQELITTNLLTKKRTQYGNKYQFTSTFFTEINLTQSKDQKRPSVEVKKIHPIKEQEKKNNKKTSLNQLPNNDDIIKTLKQWNYSNIEQLLKDHTKEIILATIEKVKKHNPENKGAYFRTLIKLPNSNHYEEEISETSLINTMIKSQYWKHKPTNKIIKIKPDIGSHFNFNYDSQTKMIIIHNENIIDKIENFKVIKDYKDIELKTTEKISKKDLISRMIQQKQYKEAFQLAKIFKLQEEYYALVS